MQERQAWGATRLLRPVCTCLVCIGIPLAQQRLGGRRGGSGGFAEGAHRHIPAEQRGRRYAEDTETHDHKPVHRPSATAQGGVGGMERQSGGTISGEHRAGDDTPGGCSATVHSYFHDVREGPGHPNAIHRRGTYNGGNIANPWHTAVQRSFAIVQSQTETYKAIQI